MNDFLVYALNGNKTHYFSSSDLALREKVVRVLKRIDFGCGFKGTKCLSEKVCCSKCVEKKGYYSKIPAKWVLELSGLWNGQKGFLSDSGCRIPHEKRSSACLGFICEDADSQHLTRVEKVLISTVKNIMVI